MQETSQIRWLMYCKSAKCKSAQFEFDSCQLTHVTDLMFIMFLCLFNNQIVSVAHSRVTFWLPPRCEPV